MRVTFDSNTLDKACRPERFPKDPNQALYQKVNTAIKAGQIQGYYSVTLLTIEAIQRKDRASVFGSTHFDIDRKITTTKNADLPPNIRDFVGGGDLETVMLNMKVVQPKRGSLPQEFQNRILAAKALGFHVLKAPPRIGSYSYTDTTSEYYLPNDDKGQLATWQERVCKVLREQESLNVGYAQAVALGKKIAQTIVPEPTWFRALEEATNPQDIAAIPKVFGEWADGDSIASHIAYGDIDVFCSNDKGNSNIGPSVLDASHRQWLTTNYGVKFITIEDIANGLS